MMKRRKNNSGMVLVTVVMIILVMSLLLTAIISQNLSQVTTTEAQIKEIKAKELALGLFWKAQADMTYTAGNPATPNGGLENLDGTEYTYATSNRPASHLVSYTTTVNY